MGFRKYRKSKRSSIKTFALHCKLILQPFGLGFFCLYVYSNIPFKVPKSTTRSTLNDFLSQKIEECFIVPRNACVVFIIDFCTAQWSDLLQIEDQLCCGHKNILSGRVEILNNSQ